MKKLFYVLILGVATVLFSSCDEECENARGECPEEQLTKDISEIERYLEDNNLTAERDASYDFFYIIEEEGTGPTAQNGQVVTANYTGRFLNGQVFDTSIESVAIDAGVFSENRQYEPFTFTIGGRVILGWNVAFKLLNAGSKATLIFPSYMAYGPRGSGSIPPNTVLLFEVELISIEN